MEQSQNINKELASISPMLAEQLAKLNTVVAAPQGYFDQLPEKMLEVAKNTEVSPPAKILYMYLNLLTRTAVAASAALLIGLAITNQQVGSYLLAMEQKQVQAELPRISDTELSNFLNNEQVLAQTEEHAHWQDVLSRIDDNELATYINEASSILESYN